MAAKRERVTVEGRQLSLSNLDKVLYPEAGVTKADVLDYLRTVGPAMIPAIRDRPATRKRWVHGVGTKDEPGEVFFQKNLDVATPKWVKRVTLEHRHSTNTYPIVNDLATLVWLGQIASLEVHVPQWRVDEKGRMLHPDRLVLDLDPGPGAGLPECVEVAHLVKPILDHMGLVSVPVTSGSKGIHLYAKLDMRQSWEQVSSVAHELARSLAADHPDLVVSDQKKTLREGRVLVDWSQNSGQKTTIAPYSLRGRLQPMVAAPRTWEEIGSPDLAHVRYDEMPARLERYGNLFAPVLPEGVALAFGAEDAGDDDGRPPPSSSAPGGRAHGEPDRLTVYRSKRDAAATPEPVPAEAPVPGEGNAFVIHEHHARRLHWDLRLEHEGVLASFALPRGVPTDPGRNHLAVHTEDHPIEYLTFSGTIPKGEYGAGEMFVWDTGTYELEKWREDKEIIVILTGKPGGGLASIESGKPMRLALIRTEGGLGGDKDNWLIHLMKDQAKGHWRRGARRDGDAAEAATNDGGVTPSDAPSPPQGAGDATPPARGGGDGATGGNSATGRGASGGGASGGGASGGGAPPSAMLAQIGTPGLIRGDKWALEMKWDGVRAIVDARGPLKLISRRGLDTTATYPELAELAELGPAILDGEIIATDSSGRPSFARLQQRMGLTDPTDVAAARREVPVRIVLFDLLEFEGHDLTSRPFSERRRALELLAEGGLPQNVQLSPVFDDDVEHVLAASAEHGMEGIMAKRLSSRYEPGRRSGAWLKIKHERTQEVVVGGWRTGKGGREGTIGSLLVGIPDDDGGLRYAGRVGSGFSDRDLKDIVARLGPLAREASPFADVPREDTVDAHWVAPELVGEVRYGEWTPDHRLRHPVWKGWRPDKGPGDVVFEG
ncbi:ATP-dependent DNA ligase [Sinomonas sp. ASV322]|uniref:ATP-dependent DNA ligase n=1 Tax=Sinomonas sp. ASV322 TaxID=3041920 RepID=UPI0027DE883F|nr:ATP-dependent DNA ligase [Sinomonas sp. ASV322]MDQ4502560.1 ATP-dependent DNA ligase [Sinomonas sp. ASV322]